jgi:hypothetical protein
MKTKRNHYQIFRTTIITFILLALILPSSLKAQREDKDSQDYGGLQFGLDFGMYLANKYPANYYNGSDGNENNIKYVFGNTYYNNEIKQLLNVSDTSKFFLREYPTNMHYPATPSAGLYISYNFNRSTGIYLQFNYVKLKPHDVFSIEVSPQDEVLTNPDLRLYSISGVEERINIDIGYSKAFRVSDNTDFMGEAGIAVNDIRVLKSSINIENKEYSLINIYGKDSYVPGASQQVYDIYEGGIGIGIHGGAGIKFNFSESFALQPGATLYWNNVNLEGYKDMRFNSFFYLRFIARQLF